MGVAARDRLPAKSGPFQLGLVAFLRFVSLDSGRSVTRTGREYGSNFLCVQT